MLVQNISDQGPRGGKRAMYWKSRLPNTFLPKDVLAYASENGWKLTDSQSIWTSEKIPHWINSVSKTYTFRTSWMLFEPGTDSSTEENGFVVINNSGNEMCVFHNWGE